MSTVRIISLFVSFLVSVYVREASLCDSLMQYKQFRVTVSNYLHLQLSASVQKKISAIIWSSSFHCQEVNISAL